jgi:hypothetical protein
MPYGEGQSGEIKYSFDFTHENGTNIQATSTISPNDPALMDQAFQDLRDLLEGWSKRHPEAGFYSSKQTLMFQELTPTPPPE